jgi:hypothetical protein
MQLCMQLDEPVVRQTSHVTLKLSSETEENQLPAAPGAPAAVRYALKA